MELGDTSVWARKSNSRLRQWFERVLTRDELTMCEMVALELLHTAPTPDMYRQLADSLQALPWLRMEASDFQRALEVQALLAERGNQLHRSVKNADLFIAAVAERTGITLVHYDKDYDTIQAVTGQPMRWVAPRGSLEPSVG
ncbi:MAG TPA: PIN domain nuclease [Chloroflexota bacterium]|nr:PIN domain nuclease [Chloroflexota bacterium]